MGRGSGGRTGTAYSRLRQIVLYRDGAYCSMCGRTCLTAGDKNDMRYATIDHIQPLGSAQTIAERHRLLMDPANCRIACRACNSNRGAVTAAASNVPDGW